MSEVQKKSTTNIQKKKSQKKKKSRKSQKKDTQKEDTQKEDTQKEDTQTTNQASITVATKATPSTTAPQKFKYALGDLTRLLSPDAVVPDYKAPVSKPGKKVTKTKIGKHARKKGKKAQIIIASADTPTPGDDDSSDSEAELKQALAIRRKKKNRTVEDPKAERTIFVGNVLLAATEKEVSRHFRQYGKVESVRFRSVAFADPKKPRRASFNTKEFHHLRDTANCYVVFQEKESVEKALVANNTVFKGKHIRVDIVTTGEKKKHNHKNSLFIGNVPFDAKEEEVYEHFAPAGDIVSVRLIRDPYMNICKGFGFVCFKERAQTKQALSLHGTKFKGRPLRVTAAEPEDKLKDSNKKADQSNKAQSRAKNMAIRLRKKGIKPFENEKNSKKGRQTNTESSAPSWSGQRAEAGGKFSGQKPRQNHPNKKRKKPTGKGMKKGGKKQKKK